MNKIAIYTCIVGDYDILQQPLVYSSLFDYICFVKKSATSKQRDGIWIIRELDYDNDNDVILSRYPKLNPHLVLPEYDYSLWIDGNLIISHEHLYRLILDKVRNDVLYSGIKHWSRDCIYMEASAIVYTGRDSLRNIISTLSYLSKHSFPTHYGMAENNVILRKHNNPKIIVMDNMWWKLFMTLSKRDQMTLSYSLKSAGVEWDYLLPDNATARNHYTFSCQLHEGTINIVKKCYKICNRYIFGNIRKIFCNIALFWIQRNNKNRL